MLGNWLADQILNEQQIKTIVVIYPGRFQPMGKHHAAVYKKLASRFGEGNTYIATSNKVDPPKSPLNFVEKAMVMREHGITNVVQVKNPYSAVEITNKYDPNTTAILFAVGKKDMMEDPRFRVGFKRSGEPSYFQYYDDNKDNLQPLTKHGYLIVAPHVSLNVSGFGEMSGTILRQALAVATEDEFRNIMGFFNPKIYNLLKTKFNQAVNENIERFLLEVSNSVASGRSLVDDGPRYYFGNQATYRSKNKKMAERLGFSVLNYIIKDNPIEVHNTEFPDGPPMSVSYFPVGAAGATDAGTNYSKELKGAPGYTAWSKYITRVAQQVGYKFLNFLGAELASDDTKNSPNTPGPLKEQLFTKSWWNGVVRELITEGGASGHMNHPFDDRDLTFGEMKEMIRLSLAGTLNAEAAVTEKTDGQNLNVTFKNGTVGAARNKATIREPMSIDAVKAKFGGRGNISDAFGFAMEDLEQAILALPEDKRNEVFQNGKRFVNLEIIYPATKNVIDYGGGAYLQFHGLNEFDLESATKIAEYPEYGMMLQRMIADTNADVQKHFKIIPPKELVINRSVDFEKREKEFIRRVDQLQSEFALKDSDEIMMYHQRWWERFISQTFPNASSDIKDGLIRRWAYQEKSYALNKKNITDLDMLSTAKEFDKQNFAKQNKANVYQFEKIFLELGAEVLSNVQEFLAVNPDEQVQKLKIDISQSIKELRKANDISALEKLKYELKRIESIGGFDKIVPSEGLVYVYKGKTYKLTGLFAPINQLLGLSRYAR